MFQVNDTILYGPQGICNIIEITEKDFGGEKADYYVLQPVYVDRSTIFIPVHNETLVAKMRRILSKEEIYQLIVHMPEQKLIWIANDNERKSRYKEIIVGGNRTDLVALIKTLYFHQKELQANGKKLHAADDRFLKDAEKILYDEFALVLRIKPQQVVSFITEQIEQYQNNQALGIAAE